MGGVADDRQPVCDGAGEGVVTVVGEGQLVGIGQGLEQAGGFRPQGPDFGLPGVEAGAAPGGMVFRPQAPEEVP